MRKCEGCRLAWSSVLAAGLMFSRGRVFARRACCASKSAQATKVSAMAQLHLQRLQRRLRHKQTMAGIFKGGPPARRPSLSKVDGGGGH